MQARRLAVNAFSGIFQGSVMRPAWAASAVTMFRHLDAKCECAKMRHLAKKIDRGFGVAAFELAVRGAHAAKRADLAVGTDGFAFVVDRANFLQPAFPTLAEGAVAEVIAIAVRDDANGHVALWIDGTAVVAAAAGVPLFGIGVIRG